MSPFPDWSERPELPLWPEEIYLEWTDAAEAELALPREEFAARIVERARRGGASLARIAQIERALTSPSDPRRFKPLLSELLNRKGSDGTFSETLSLAGEQLEIVADALYLASWYQLVLDELASESERKRRALEALHDKTPIEHRLRIFVNRILGRPDDTSFQEFAVQRGGAKPVRRYDAREVRREFDALIAGTAGVVRLRPCLRHSGDEDDPAEQRTAARVQQYRRKGLTLREIGEQLASDGVLAPGGGQWRPATVASLLRGFQPSCPDCRAGSEPAGELTDKEARECLRAKWALKEGALSRALAPDRSKGPDRRRSRK